MKWYEYRSKKTLELIWWTQRDKNSNCFEIRKEQGSNTFKLFVNDLFRAKYQSLNDAQRAARAIACFY